jgi:hypothetical protein
MSTAKCRGAVAPALQAAPPLLCLVDSQILRRQRVSPATNAWDILPSEFAPIDTGEVDDRRTISTKHAPATTCNGLHRYAPGCDVREPVGRLLSQVERRRSRLSYSSPVRLLFPSLVVRSRVRLFAFRRIAPLFEGRKQTAG